jgi:hypothetical protein
MADVDCSHKILSEEGPYTTSSTWYHGSVWAGGGACQQPREIKVEAILVEQDKNAETPTGSVHLVIHVLILEPFFVFVGVCVCFGAFRLL